MLTFDEKKQVIDECLRLGILAFDFIGGESHLDSNFEELVRHAKPYKHYISLATNGLGFTREKVKKFRDMGIDKFNISIDSWFADKHDEFRNKKGSYQSAFSTLNLCKELGMSVGINIVVYKDYTKEEGFKKLVQYCIDNKVSLAFKLALPVGQWQNNFETLASESDKQEIERLHALYPFLTRDIHGNQDNSCPAFKDFFTISAYGDVMPCNAIHISFGNIRQAPLVIILQQVKKMEMFSKKYKGCPPAEDFIFIQKVLSKTYNACPYPIEAKNIFDELKK